MNVRNPQCPAVPRMHLDTHSFREGQRADTSLESTGADNLQGGQGDAVPDPDVGLQRLEASEMVSQINPITGNPQPQFIMIFFVTSSVHFLFRSCAEDKSEGPFFLYPSIFVHSCDLSRGDPDLVGVDGQAGRQTASNSQSGQSRSSTGVT